MTGSRRSQVHTRHRELFAIRTQRTIALSQSAYARDVLRTYGMATCNSAATPVRPDVRLTVRVEGYVAELSDTRRYQADGRRTYVVGDLHSSGHVVCRRSAQPLRQ